ncbi:MAG: hypothetical protein WA823_20910 [Candidatus Acidiferrales bacterium]
MDSLTTAWKLCTAGAVGVTLMFTYAVLGIISDIVKEKGEDWLFDSTKVIIHDPTTRKWVDKVILKLAPHPDFYLILAAIVLFLLIAAISAIQVRRVIQTGKIHLSDSAETAAPVSAVANPPMSSENAWNLKVEDIHPEHDTSPKSFYKLKLVFDLVNSGNRDIKCRSLPTWRSNPGDAGLQDPFHCGYWVYPEGKTQWVDNIPDP